ncbi:hypothetical protein VOLCADRAFT_92834 [Volvox carteri f. nagariensis]|uniref:Fucolectin tachylectin-4 pentraxin-1 domain-containing protein n=1 Tax=Volvox carteri f. nagariensis TaxID=3068 RepID=D8U0L0_VOLCA|nr:uncharacterized protein VOLCADRAFT_92834 [Volvox carteri f. nagariensis]EFJ46738.1 hypothetical protein VOLCADRAFT_92834 [Volvox carteri f. nagariensis]|eukprot:XP_002952267.1 hypothetical protein VOLCADRAFT_92834 [Volvox carteri f. nagariensis]
MTTATQRTWCSHHCYYQRKKRPAAGSTLRKPGAHCNNHHTQKRQRMLRRLLPLILLGFMPAPPRPMSHFGANAQGLAPKPPLPPPPPPLTPLMTNIAIGKRIYAASQLSNQYAAINANDGIIPPDGSNSSTYISAPSNSTSQWLSIDFGEAVTIGSVAIYFGRGCCFGQPSDYEFRLGGRAIDLTVSDLSYPGSLNAVIYNLTYGASAAASGSSEDSRVGGFSINPLRTGRVFSIERLLTSATVPDSLLAVSELQVFGTPAGGKQPTKGGEQATGGGQRGNRGGRSQRLGRGAKLAALLQRQRGGSNRNQTK